MRLEEIETLKVGSIIEYVRPDLATVRGTVELIEHGAVEPQIWVKWADCLGSLRNSADTFAEPDFHLVRP